MEEIEENETPDTAKDETPSEPVQVVPDAPPQEPETFEDADDDAEPDFEAPESEDV